MKSMRVLAAVNLRSPSTGQTLSTLALRPHPNSQFFTRNENKVFSADFLFYLKTEWRRILSLPYVFLLVEYLRKIQSYNNNTNPA